jgi:glyoxylase-like metal-dependent hydrolase (beta-lactamase superfamily II)
VETAASLRAVSDWFVTRELGPGFHLIAEPFHVNSYLVEGTASRVHLDTGLGVADIREAGDALSARPPFAANTHYHFDHTGGNGRFDEIAIHELGVDLLAAGPGDEIEGYRRWAERMIERWPEYRALDDGYFGLTDDVSTLQPFPKGFDFDSWTVEASKATRTLHEGEALDLGGRSLRVIHTPGHSPDSVCYLDEREGLLFAGDTVNSGPILAIDPVADVQDFARSTRRLADELMSSVKWVLMAHGARFMAEPAYLRDVADGFEQLAAGEATVEPFHIDYAEGSRIARFPRFSIMLPPAAGT